MQIFICNFTKKIFLSAEEINFIEIKVNAEYLQKFCRCGKISAEIKTEINF